MSSFLLEHSSYTVNGISVSVSLSLDNPSTDKEIILNHGGATKFVKFTQFYTTKPTGVDLGTEFRES